MEVSAVESVRIAGNDWTFGIEDAVIVGIKIVDTNIDRFGVAANADAVGFAVDFAARNSTDTKIYAGANGAGMFGACGNASGTHVDLGWIAAASTLDAIGVVALGICRDCATTHS